MAFIRQPDEQENLTPSLGGGSTMVDTSQPSQVFGKVSNYLNQAQSPKQTVGDVDLSGLPKFEALKPKAVAEPWNVKVPNYTPAAPIQKTPEVQARDDMFLQNVRQQSDQANKVRQDAIDFTNNNQAAVQANNNNFLQSVRTESDRLNAQRQAAIDFTNNNQAAVKANNDNFLESVRQQSMQANAVRQKSIDDYYAANPDKLKYKLANEALYGKDVW